MENKAPFDKGVVVNIYGTDSVAIMTQYGPSWSMPFLSAQWFVKLLLDNGIKVRAYWADTIERERQLDPRIELGMRT